MTDISHESVEIFTEFPHPYRSIEELIEFLDTELERPFMDPDSRLARNFSLDGKVVVDAGCGCGTKSIQMANLGTKLTIGVDGSQSGINTAGALARHFEFENTKFILGFLEDLEELLANEGLEHVDYVHNIGNIHHVSDWKQVLGIFYRVLAPGGFTYISWVEPSIRFGSFNIKNKIAYALGSTPEQRAKIGGFLFGWWDQRHNMKQAGADGFYADLYAAFYKIITVGQFRREAERLGFEFVEGDPPLDIGTWVDVRPPGGKRDFVARAIDVLPFLKPLFTLALRLRQFVGYGSLRSVVLRKPE